MSYFLVDLASARIASGDCRRRVLVLATSAAASSSVMSPVAMRAVMIAAAIGSVGLISPFGPFGTLGSPDNEIIIRRTASHRIVKFKLIHYPTKLALGAVCI